MYRSAIRNQMILLGLITVLGGCSMDKHVFVSSVDKPMSVALVDTHRDRTLWEMDIPVYHKLVLDFDRPLEFEPIRANMEPATKLSWRLYNLNPKAGRYIPVEWNSRDLPGTPFVIRVSLRPAPEFPPEFRLAETPPPPPAATMQTLETMPSTAPTEAETLPAEIGSDSVTPSETAEPAAPADGEEPAVLQEMETGADTE